MLLSLLPLTGCSDRGARLPETTGGWEDIDGYIARLVAAEDYAVLVVDAGEPGAFLQFSSVADTVQLDFPLITDAQKAREASIRQFLKNRDLPAVINPGTAGGRFLDCDLPADPPDAGVHGLPNPGNATVERHLFRNLAPFHGRPSARRYRTAVSAQPTASELRPRSASR